MFVEVEIGNDLFGKVGILHLLAEFGVKSSKELDMRHLEKFIMGKSRVEGRASS